jgi:hypothetical protein
MAKKRSRDLAEGDRVVMDSGPVKLTRKLRTKHDPQSPSGPVFIYEDGEGFERVMRLPPADKEVEVI